MKTGGDKGKITSFELDLRVRDRHLASGVLDAKTVEQYLGELPDVEEQAEELGFDQPALSGESASAGQTTDPDRSSPTAGPV